MTPTEQDKLRELVHIVQNADTTYDAIKFITADRKRVEVEARISILEDVYDDDRPLKTFMDIKKRIAELEAQQEEV